MERHLARDPDHEVITSDHGVAVLHAREGRAVISAIAVDPAHRRQGEGSELLTQAEHWAGRCGLTSVVVGPAVPVYLWPGVEVGLTSLETFLEGRRYRVVMWAVNQEVTLPQDIPVGRARRATRADTGRVAEFCRDHYPNWEAEARFSFEGDPPTCAVWDEGDDLLGFACWSVVRQGWFGPMATRPDLRGKGRGVGTGTLSLALEALHAEGRATADIAWVGPERFYTKAAGARVHRVFRVFSRALT